MNELLEKIETLLAAAPDQQPINAQSVKESEGSPYHPLTSWTGDRIVQLLTAQMPAANGDREKEALRALYDKQYSRCQMYLQLVEGNAYIQAIGCISKIPKATQSGLLTLPTLFNESARAVIKVHEQTIAALENASQAKQNRDRSVKILEKLAIDVFARGLGDESEQ